MEKLVFRYLSWTHRQASRYICILHTRISLNFICIFFVIQSTGLDNFKRTAQFWKIVNKSILAVLHFCKTIIGTFKGGHPCVIYSCCATFKCLPWALDWYSSIYTLNSIQLYRLVTEPILNSSLQTENINGAHRDCSYSLSFVCFYVRLKLMNPLTDLLSKLYLNYRNVLAWFNNTSWILQREASNYYILSFFTIQYWNFITFADFGVYPFKSPKS